MVPTCFKFIVFLQVLNLKISCMFYCTEDFTPKEYPPETKFVSEGDMKNTVGEGSNLKSLLLGQTIVAVITFVVLQMVGMTISKVSMLKQRIIKGLMQQPNHAPTTKHVPGYSLSVPPKDYLVC